MEQSYSRIVFPHLDAIAAVTSGRRALPVCARKTAATSARIRKMTVFCPRALFTRATMTPMSRGKPRGDGLRDAANRERERESAVRPLAQENRSASIHYFSQINDSHKRDARLASQQQLRIIGRRATATYGMPLAHESALYEE